ncbi:hypothetical protein N7465_000509 [Penicillium sp. CMV-2018d]|nr:hypothetical protein N7465_000509 [Penicillium sp. CMV-2018d]
MSKQLLDKDLYQAAAGQNLRTARSLLDRGANPNVEGFEYNSALQAAARRDSVELVQLLLDRGAQVNAQGGYHGSALIAAAQYGNIEIVKLLISAKANLNICGRYGTALAVARDKHHEDVVNVLLRAGATERRPNTEELDKHFGLRF